MALKVNDLYLLRIDKSHPKIVAQPHTQNSKIPIGHIAFYHYTLLIGKLFYPISLTLYFL